jgi:hypothetical protein
MFTTRISRPSAVAIAAAAALAAGCGGEDRLTEDEYAAELRPAVAQISSGFGSVFERIGRASDAERVPAAALARLGQVAAAEAGTADRLAGLEPPEELEQAHDRFAAGARRQAESLAELARSRSTTVGQLADAIEQGETVDALRELVSRGVVPAPGR